MAWCQNLNLLQRSAIVLAFALTTATADAADRPGEADAKKLVAMVRGSLAGSSTLGAAVVIGAANDRLYLVTADHVVRKEGEVATDLKVELRTLPGESLAAEVLPHHDRELDLAVLMVHDVALRGVPVDSFPFDRLGDSGSLNRGAGVFSIGQSGATAWWTNVDSDVVAERSGSFVYFQSPLLRSGQSGGGLFDANWLLIALVLGEERSAAIKAVLIEEVLSFLRRNNYPIALTAGPSRHNSQLNCPTKRENFDGTLERLWEDGGGGHFGYDRSAFNMTVAWQGAVQKRCLDCRVKSSTFRVSANVWDNGKAASWGLYILDMSENRGEMFSLELEQDNRVALKHYRDGQAPSVLWAGTYRRQQEKTRLTVEAREGTLIASVNGTELGRATYDPKLIPDVALGAGFLVAAGAQIPASVWFDDYEFTACFASIQAR